MAERLTISRLGRAGDGVAEFDGRPIHVSAALPGETVLAEVEGSRGKVVAIEVGSSDRATPFCRYFGDCGGCVLQHLEQNVYAAWKREKVVSQLIGRGLEASVGPLVDAHGAGRRRITLHLRRLDGTIRAGFMAAGTHRLVPIERCPITVPTLARAPAAAEALARRVMSEKPLDAVVTASDEGLDIDLRGLGRPHARKLQALVAVASELDLARLSVHGDIVVERRRPVVPLGRSLAVPPPGGFLQATARGEEVLAAEVLRAAAGRRRVVDLFSGIGPFALRLAQTAEVHAVEGQAAMLAALDRAARETPGLRRVTTETRDLFKRPLLASEFDRFDLAVIDPPRQGAEAQARQIASSSLDRVILVSCDPGTFARDAALLVEGGFRLESVLPIDQFKWSTHVEMVGVLARPSMRRR